MTSEEDVSQFDTKFTEMTPLDSPDDSMLSESANRVFLGFNYVAPSVLEAMAKQTARSFALGRSYTNRSVEEGGEIEKNEKKMIKILFWAMNKIFQ